jgi:hypothetical protein
MFTRRKELPPMKQSYLIQRLDPPRGGPANPFSFGGGLRNGGLSDDAMGLLTDVFSFDYMGAAEFEFGAVPEALRGLAADSGRLVAFSFPIPLAKVKKHWRDKSKEKPKGDAEIFVICRDDHADEVKDRILVLARDEMRLKEWTRFPEMLRPDPTEEERAWSPQTCGWLELDNGWFFFTDRTMWESVATLFEVKLPEPVG